MREHHDMLGTALERGRKRALHPGVLLEPLAHLGVEVGGRVVGSCGHEGPLHPADPAIEDVAESASGAGGGA